ncbi:TolC family outer membrane protein [Oceanimonas smirnovii]|uniref:TolC family outer membrane protein n=1 Tax=Oceanimonas smirnovii TaxID=264574 RepID=UPI00376F9F53
MAGFKAKRTALAIGIMLMMGSAQAEDLKVVLTEALEHNPEVRFQAEALRAQQAEQRKEKGAYLPSVDLDASVGVANRDYDDRGSFDRDYAELSVTQLLFNGFGTKGRVEEAGHQVTEEYFKLREEAENKALEVARAYLDVQRYRYLTELAQRNVDSHLEVRDQVIQRADRGVANKADLYQTEGRLALAQSNLRTELSNLQSVTARFQRLVGRAPGAHLDETLELSVGLPADLEVILDRVYRHNPALYASFANIDAAESAMTIAEANYYPTLELGLRHGVYKNNNSFDNRTDPSSRGEESLIELRARYNLFRGGSDKAARKAAYHRVSQAESLRDKTCVDLRQTATIAWSELQNLKQKTNLLLAHKESSIRVVEAYRQQFGIGRRSLLDVLDSENEAYQAERNYIQGHYDLLLTRAQVLNSTGELLATMKLSPLPEEFSHLGDEQEQRELPARYCTALSDAYVTIK